MTDEPYVWCVVANVVEERPYGSGGAETQRGVKIFRAGAKVYVAEGFGGDGWEAVTVVGRPRSSPRFVAAKVRTEHLTNWRVRAVYSPAARHQIALVRRGFPGFWLRTEEPVDSEAFRDALIEAAENFREAAELGRAQRPGG